MTIVQSGLLLAVSMPFVLAIWIAFRYRQQSTADQGYTTFTTFEDDPVSQCFGAVSADLNAVIGDAVLAVNSLAHSSWVRIESAVEAAMPVPVSASVLRTSVYDALRTAIHAAPGGQVLVTAMVSGNQVRIRVTDDGPGTDQLVRDRSMRQIEASLTAQGGSLLVEARPGRGTTVTIAAPILTAADQPASAQMQLPVLADQAV